MMMMRFQNFDVPPLDKLRRHLFDKLCQQRDADRGIGAIDKRHGVRHRGQRGLFLARQAGGANHHGTALIRRNPGMNDTRGRAGEVDQHISVGEDFRIVRDQHIVPARAG